MRLDDNRASDLEREAMAWPPRGYNDADGEAKWLEACAAVDAIPAPLPSAKPADYMREIAQTALLSLLMLIGMRAAFGNFVVESYSMEPTLVEGERIWVTRLESLWSDAPDRGAIVVFQAWGQNKPFVKRVIGLPGETVEVRDDRVWVDGVALEEPYLHEATTGRYGPMTLADDQVFVMGDNRDNSADSRTYGALPISTIAGTARVRYWPIGHIAWLGGAHPVLAGSAP